MKKKKVKGAKNTFVGPSSLSPHRPYICGRTYVRSMIKLEGGGGGGGGGGGPRGGK